MLVEDSKRLKSLIEGLNIEVKLNNSSTRFTKYVKIDEGKIELKIKIKAIIKVAAVKNFTIFLTFNFNIDNVKMYEKINAKSADLENVDKTPRNINIDANKDFL